MPLNLFSPPSAGSSRFASQISMIESLSIASSSLLISVSPFARMDVAVISTSAAPGVRIEPSFVIVESLSFDLVRLFSVVKASVAPSAEDASLKILYR